MRNCPGKWPWACADCPEYLKKNCPEINKTKKILEVSEDCTIHYSDGSMVLCDRAPPILYADCPPPGYGPGGHCPKYEYLKKAGLVK